MVNFLTAVSVFATIFCFVFVGNYFIERKAGSTRTQAILLDRIVSTVSSTEVYELRMTNGSRCAVAVNILLNNKEPFGSQIGVSCK